MERITLKEWYNEPLRVAKRAREKAFADRLWLMRSKKSGWKLKRIKGFMALVSGT